MSIVNLTTAPVRVSGAEKQNLRLAVDVSPYNILDLELSLLDDGGSTAGIRLLTGNQRESDAGWVEVDSFVPSGAPATLKKSFFPLLRYVRWEVTAGSPTFTLKGLGRVRRTFLPTDLASCVVWLRSDRGISLSSGNVSAWADKSGAGNDIAQATGSKQPAYLSSELNGFPALQFDGVDDNLQANLANTFAGTNQDFTFFTVAYVDSTASSGAIYDLSDSLSQTNRGPMFFYETNTVKWRCFQVAGQATYSSPPYDSWHRHAAYHETTERRVYLDGVEKASELVSTDVVYERAT